MEYAESDLKKIIKSNINLEMLHIQTIIYNLLCSIKYLHESNVLHRDLKPANVLINEDCTVKLCDYGLARSISGIESADVILSKADVADDAGEPDSKSSSNSSEGTPKEFMMLPGANNSSVSLKEGSMSTESTPKEGQNSEEKKENLRAKLVKTKD